MSNRAFVLLTVFGLASLSWSATLRLDARAQAASVVTYTASDEDFANPERGFFVQRSYNPARANPRGLDVEQLRGVREQPLSMVRMLYSLAAYRDEAIPAEYLTQIEADFAAARQAGVKLIPRFAYNSGPIGAPDAPLERMLAHIDQLTPVLRAHSDVLAFLEAGFAGAWGEWHNSTNDHLPYARAGIPALFFSTLLHADYHTPFDNPDRIDITKLTKMTRWMYATGRAVAEADKAPAVDPAFKLERCRDYTGNYCG
jgi:hypothetical protein